MTFPRLSLAHRPTRFVALVAIVSALMTTAVSPAAMAADASWGPEGITSTDSAVTVRWDNEANPETSVVPRDATQIVALTNGKTYDDIRPTIKDTYAQYFGDVSMTVSQTRDLRNQAITVSFVGLPAAKTADGAGSAPYGEMPVQVFQCWGAPGGDGVPDPAATSPDPRTCQVGALGADAPKEGAAPGRSVKGDRLLVSGADIYKEAETPLLSIAGVETPGTEFEREFNRTTTNELSKVVSSLGGAVERAFEVHTGAESAFLGCGERPDAPSTSRCWLVAVPIATKAASDLQMVASGWINGLTPSLWAQRMQVALDFAPVSEACPGGQSRVLAAGSEVATLAMRSWIPGLCADKEIASGYSQLSDDQARRQLDAGGASLVYTSQSASSDAVYAPTALSGVAIGLTIDYRPVLCNQGAAAACETPDDYPDIYSDRQTYLREAQKAGTPIRDIRLNARLVAKLLTQSYGVDSTGVGVANADPPFFEKAPFLQERSNWSLLSDTEFTALNPQLKFQRLIGSADSLKKLDVGSLASDAAASLWEWIRHDADAAAFLNGCPDPAGRTINPWYSTRTYAGCEEIAAELEKTAAAQRAATQVPPTFDRSSPLDYSRLTSPYPQVLYVETSQGQDVDTIKPATMVDMYPPLADQSAAARAGVRATKQRGVWCGSVGGCAPSLWKSTALPGAQIGVREVGVVTDTASAARYQLTTAQLCDGDGTACVGPDKQSITRQAERFSVTSASQIATPPDEPDYAGGAYPLTILVSAASVPSRLTPSTAQPIANVLEYVATSGQVEGTGPGQLLPGYAQLTPRLVWQSFQAVAALRAVPERAVQSSAGKPAQAASGQAVPAAVTAFVPKAVAPPAAAAGAPAPAPAAPQPSSTPLAGARTGATEIGYPQLGLTLGLCGAVLAALFVPVFGRSRKAESE